MKPSSSTYQKVILLVAVFTAVAALMNAFMAGLALNVHHYKDLTFDILITLFWSVASSLFVATYVVEKQATYGKRTLDSLVKSIRKSEKPPVKHAIFEALADEPATTSKRIVPVKVIKPAVKSQLRRIGAQKGRGAFTDALLKDQRNAKRRAARALAAASAKKLAANKK